MSLSAIPFQSLSFADVFGLLFKSSPCATRWSRIVSFTEIRIAIASIFEKETRLSHSTAPYRKITQIVYGKCRSIPGLSFQRPSVARPLQRHFLSLKRSRDRLREKVSLKRSCRPNGHVAKMVGPLTLCFSRPPWLKFLQKTHSKSF